MALSAAATHRIYKANITPTRSSILAANVSINKLIDNKVNSTANKMLITSLRLKKIPVRPIQKTIKPVLISKFNVLEPEKKLGVNTTKLGRDSQRTVLAVL
jgi:hypothetical protein